MKIFAIKSYDLEHSPHIFAALLFLFFTSIDSILRIILISNALVNGSIEGIFQTMEILLNGALADAITIGALMLPLTIVQFVTRLLIGNTNFINTVARVSLFFAIFLIVVYSIIEYQFWLEFQQRPNFIAVDYLMNRWQHLTRMLQVHALTQTMIWAFIGSTFTYVILNKMFLKRVWNSESEYSPTIWPMVFCFFMAMTFFELYDPNSNRFSDGSTSSELSKNGIATFIKAVDMHDLSYSGNYLLKENSLVFNNLKIRLDERNANFVNHANPLDIRRQVINPPRPQQMNVVLIILESLNSSYLERNGGDPDDTPFLNFLTQNSLYFNNIYATSTNTSSGIESIFLSKPPVPGTHSINKNNLPHSYSLGHIMTSFGYQNKFFYGGYGDIDNLTPFFRSTQFNTLTRETFTTNEVTFANLWGISDSDVYAKMLNEATLDYQDKSPFFYTILTTSNHKPYSFPLQALEDIKSPDSPQKAALRYSDHALSEFFMEAAKAPWFENTLFVVTSDHCLAHFSTNGLSLDNYHIPLLFFSKNNIFPTVADKLGSQIDIAPTLLSLLGLSYESKFFGMDLTTSKNSRALISNRSQYALVTSDKITMLLPKSRIISYKLDEKGNQLDIIDRNDAESFLDTLSYYQGSYIESLQNKKR